MRSPDAGGGFAVLAALLVGFPTPIRAETLSGVVTATASGGPLAGITVGGTREQSLAGLPPGAAIPVEFSARTASGGSYSILIDPATPGRDKIFVYTLSTLHFNEMYPNSETSGFVPHTSDASLPGVTAIDLTGGDATAIDFTLDSNKTTTQVLMRDGVTHLATDVYLPSRMGTFPVLLQRTPYNKDTDNYGAIFLWWDYAMVVQDLRGRNASEGQDRAFYDEAWGTNQDGNDTVAWIQSQPWFDGHLGTFGGSARGITQYLLGGTDATGYDCGVPIVGTTNLYADTFYPGGVFLKSMIEGWLAGQGNLAYLPEIVAHPNYDDYWKTLDLSTRAPALHSHFLNIGGWYDIHTQGTLDAFTLLQHSGAPDAVGKQKLVMGPWTHGGIGGLTQGELTYPANVNDADLGAYQLLWYEYWMKGVNNGVMDFSPVLYYVMGDVATPGAPGNFWRWASDWPPPSSPVPFYLHAGGGLDRDGPKVGEPPDAYLYDPADPVPTIGGNNLTIAAGPFDQASLESRPDVLVYSTAPLTTPVEVTGRLTATLWASSDAPDTDWTVKLCDVYPDGRSILVMDGVLRARHRESMATETFLSPSEVNLFNIDLWSTSIVFNAGHRIRVDLSSSNDPRFDPNPNTGHPFRADTAMQVASNAIYHDPEAPSYVLLPVLKDRTNGCSTASDAGVLKAAKIKGGAVRFVWNGSASDACFDAWQVYGSDDPGDWPSYERNLLASTSLCSFASKPPYRYYVVTAAGSDGRPGPR